LTALYPWFRWQPGRRSGRDGHYYGSMHVGLHADPAALPDLDTLAQHFTPRSTRSSPANHVEHGRGHVRLW